MRRCPNYAEVLSNCRAGLRALNSISTTLSTKEWKTIYIAKHISDSSGDYRGKRNEKHQVQPAL